MGLWVRLNTRKGVMFVDSENLISLEEFRFTEYTAAEEVTRIATRVSYSFGKDIAYCDIDASAEDVMANLREQLAPGRISPEAQAYLRPTERERGVR